MAWIFRRNPISSDKKSGVCYFMEVQGYYKREEFPSLEKRG